MSTLQAVRSMCLGEQCKAKIPAELGYGEDGSPARGLMPDIPPNADLEFELELMTIGKDDSQFKAIKNRLEVARTEREAAAAKRKKQQKEKVIFC